MYKRKIALRIVNILLCMAVYFLIDYLVSLTGFLKFGSFVGIKSFMPVTFGLLFGLYGVIGEILASTLSAILLRRDLYDVLIEYLIIIIPGIGAWFMWHMKSMTHKIHFRYNMDYIKYLIIIIITYLICAYIGDKLVGGNSFRDIMIWGISLSILVGIPVCIIYSGLMCLNPILPPLKDKDGKLIAIKDDIVYNLNSDNTSLLELNEKVELLCEKNNIDMKRLFEIQSCIEELYVRIISNVPNIYIDTRVNYDIVFSIELNYISKKYNPLFTSKTDDITDIAGLKLVKHRALLASFSYFYGENNIHVVI